MGCLLFIKVFLKYGPFLKAAKKKKNLWLSVLAFKRTIDLWLAGHLQWSHTWADGCSAPDKNRGPAAPSSICRAGPKRLSGCVCAGPPVRRADPEAATTMEVKTNSGREEAPHAAWTEPDPTDPFPVIRISPQFDKKVLFLDKQHST